LSEAKSQHSEYEREAEPRRTPRKEWRPSLNSNDFRIDIPEFEGLDTDEFLDGYTLTSESLRAKMYLKIRK